MKIICEIHTQIILIIILLSINTLAYIGVIPTTSDLTETISNMFTKYGLPLVAIFSFFENIGGFNAYFPGSVVILTAMSLTAGDPFKAIITFLFIIIPSIAAHNANYFFGKFINSKKYNNTNIVNKNSADTDKLSKFTIFFSTLWHPHFAAITCIASGSEGLSYRKFLKYFLPACIFWNIFWGMVMYYFGDLVNSTSNLMPLFYGYIVIWALFDIKKYYKGKPTAVP